MEALKRARKVQRTAFSKSYSKLETLIAASDVDTELLASELNIFNSKAERLDQTHIKILELLDEDDEFESEYETVEEFRDKALKIVFFVKGVIEVSQVESNAAVHDRSICSDKKFKLPKLELRMFDGDVREWLQFWSQFEKIHLDKDIADSDKFQYLIQATVEGSRAREVVESYPPTATNYGKAVDSLKSRFGCDDLLVEVYVRELLKLVLRNAASQSTSYNLCALYDSLESQIRALETLGVTTEKSAALLFPLVESCLPEKVLKAWQGSPNSNHGSDPETRLQSLLKFLKAKVESEERINLAMAGFGIEEGFTFQERSRKSFMKGYQLLKVC